MGEVVGYKNFREHFGECVKLGAHTNPKNCTKSAELARPHSSKSGGVQISMRKSKKGPLYYEDK